MLTKGMLTRERIAELKTNLCWTAMSEKTRKDLLSLLTAEEDRLDAETVTEEERGEMLALFDSIRKRSSDSDFAGESEWGKSRLDRIRALIASAPAAPGKAEKPRVTMEQINKFLRDLDGTPVMDIPRKAVRFVRSIGVEVSEAEVAEEKGE